MESHLAGTVSACLLALVTTLSNAAQVNYLFEGDWTLFSGTDDYNLNGAHFLWTITAETTSPTVSTSVTADGREIAFYEPLSSSITFTNRSNGALDTIASGLIPLLRTTNADIASSGLTDIFETETYYLDGEFSGLAVTQFSLNFANDFYFEDGFALLPENAEFTEATSAFAGSLIDDTPTKYVVSSWSMSVQPVPIPPAIWLFASGLIGLIGLAKRRMQ